VTLQFTLFIFFPEEYTNCLADILVKILLVNKCRPSEFRHMTLEEFNSHTVEKSLAGNDYFVVNPANHKTSRLGLCLRLIHFSNH
jgi:hypothetical protein